MIETTSSVINQQVADAAFASLDEEVTRKRAEGVLAAGQCTNEKLSWTTETLNAAKEFEKSIDVTPLKILNVIANKGSDIQWAGPIIYADVLAEPLKYEYTALGYGVVGILALGPLHLPDVGDSRGVSISSGSVAYFRDNLPVVYKSCSGRGILFYIKTK